MEKILVAEDSIIVNQHICKTLEGSGYEVHSAFTGKEAVKVANEVMPDLILMDIMMEGKSDGIEAALEINITLDIPVIFLTALTDTDTLEKVKVSQPYGYIVKPFNEVELLSNIQVALHKAKAENEVKNNRDLFQASINSIDEGFVLMDENLGIYYTNQRAEALFGQKFKALLGKTVNDLLGFQDKAGKSYTFSDLDKIEPSDLQGLELSMTVGKSTIAVGDLLIKKVGTRDGLEYTLFLFKDITDRVKARELEAQLEKKRIASLIEGQENERDRLAREIHDGIGQMINLIKLKLTNMTDSTHRDELMTLVNQTVEEVRIVAENLHPSLLKDFPLEKCVDKLVGQYNAQGAVLVDFKSGDLPEVTMNAKTHLYRITQESLSNIIKHAEATKASVQMYGMDDQIQLTIEDNGKGFDPAHVDNTDAHHGLENIRHRVGSLNGTITVESHPGKGTTILVTVPKKS
jgi:PAS domain S-box-containing protein